MKAAALFTAGGFLAGFLLSLFLTWLHKDFDDAQRHGHRKGPEPLPVCFVKPGERFEVARGCWPILIGRQDEITVWMVVRIDQLAPPPAPQPVEHATDVAHAPIVPRGAA